MSGHRFTTSAGGDIAPLAPHAAARRIVLGLLVAVLTLLLGTPVASSAPVKDLNNLPTELQKYVPGSTAWSSSPWMTSATCAGRGGDFSLWASNVIADTPALLAHFQASAFGAEMQPEDKARNEQILAGYRQIADVLSDAVPTGYCVDDVKRWGRPESSAKPFGVAWGVTDENGARTGYYCTDRESGKTREDEDNRHFGAERAGCDGFHIACDNAQSGAEKTKCAAWNAFSAQYVQRVATMRGEAIQAHPAVARTATQTRVEWGGVTAGGGAVLASVVLAGVLLVVLRRRWAHGPGGR
ncbi:hypothetical protein SUDANB95_08017 (plasmid) [Actinosynnema sp. ALI-1.44]